MLSGCNQVPGGGGSEARPAWKASQSESARDQSISVTGGSNRAPAAARLHLERALRTASRFAVCAPTRPVTLKTTHRENTSNPRVFPACTTYRHSAAAARSKEEAGDRQDRARGTSPRATGRTLPVASSCGRQLQWPVGHAGEMSWKRARPRDEGHPDAKVKQATRLQATVEASARRSAREREGTGCNQGPRRRQQRSVTGCASEPTKSARDQSISVTGGNNRAPAAASLHLERALRTASRFAVCAPTRPATLKTTRHENISNPRGFPACTTYRC